MKQKICINILPTYKVDQTTDYLMFDSSDTAVGDLVKYEEILEKLSKKYIIEKIIVSGGEISLLSDLYFDLLYRIISLYTKNIEVHTNFNKFNPALINGVDIITVLYNFTENTEVLKNIKAAIQIGKIISIQTLDIACEKENPETIITLLNKMNIKSWEIIPHQTTAYAKVKSKGYQYFENTVLNFIRYSQQMNFAFHNKLQLDGIIQSDNYEINTVYLTPHNKLALAEYNKGFGLKEYTDLDTFTTNLNKHTEKQLDYCKACKIKLKCMTNYYKDFTNNSDTCCGFSNLIYKYSAQKEQK